MAIKEIFNEFSEKFCLGGDFEEESLGGNYAEVKSFLATSLDKILAEVPAGLFDSRPYIQEMRDSIKKEAGL